MSLSLLVRSGSAALAHASPSSAKPDAWTSAAALRVSIDKPTHAAALRQRINRIEQQHRVMIDRLFPYLDIDK